MEQDDILIGIISVAGPVIQITPGGVYEGPYTITPHIDQQTFQTQNKTMTDNLAVQAIPYYETSNPHGLTVIIGGTNNG